jgi:hypothetical protein
MGSSRRIISGNIINRTRKPKRITIELKAVLELDPDPSSSKSVPEQMRELTKRYSLDPLQLLSDPRSVVVVHGRDSKKKE